MILERINGEPMFLPSVVVVVVVFFTVIMVSREGLMGNVLQHSGSPPPPCLGPVPQNTRSSTALGEILGDACILPFKVIYNMFLDQ